VRRPTLSRAAYNFGLGMDGCNEITPAPFDSVAILVGTDVNPSERPYANSEGAGAADDAYRHLARRSFESSAAIPR
jgi:hypothetical protein